MQLAWAPSIVLWGKHILLSHGEPSVGIDQKPRANESNLILNQHMLEH